MKSFGPFPSFGFYRDSEGLQIVNLNPARGTETRHKPEGRAPDSHLANRSLSPPAILLRDAMAGDESAERLFIDHLASIIIETAKVENWRLKGDLRGLAIVAVHPYIYKELMGQEAGANACKVSRGPYRRNWEKRLNNPVRGWVKKIYSEL